MPKIKELLLYPVEFSVASPYIPMFLSHLAKANLDISSLKYKNEKLVARCKIGDYATISRLAQKSSTKLKITKKPLPIFYAVSFCSCHFAMVISVVVALVLLSLASKTVWQVKVVGQCAGIDEQRLVDQLKPMGIFVGSNPSNTTKSNAEMQLLACYENLAWVHINRFGTVMQVEIKEATKKPPITPSYYSNFVATEDGIIVSAKVFDGWQEKRAGDSVTEGDILINGVYENKDKKLNLFAHAHGEYIAQVQESFCLRLNRQQITRELAYTKSYPYFYFFGLSFPLFVGKIPTQDTTISVSKNMASLNGVELPLGLVTKTASTYQKSTRVLDDKELLQNLKLQASQKILDQYSKKDILATNIQYNLAPSYAVAQGSVTVLKSIGEVRRITK